MRISFHNFPGKASGVIIEAADAADWSALCDLRDLIEALQEERRELLDVPRLRGEDLAALDHIRHELQSLFRRGLEESEQRRSERAERLQGAL